MAAPSLRFVDPPNNDPLDEGYLRARRVRLTQERGLRVAHTAGDLRELPWALEADGTPTLPLSVLEALYVPAFKLHADAAQLPAMRLEVSLDKLDALEEFMGVEAGINFAAWDSVGKIAGDIKILAQMDDEGEFGDEALFVLRNADTTACQPAPDPNTVVGTLLDNICMSDLGGGVERGRQGR